MILGLSFQTYTLIHTVISLIGIASGLIALYGMIAGKRPDIWTPIFLVSTVLTSVTGFGFPFARLLPSHIVGIISLAVLAAAIRSLRFPPVRGVALDLYRLRGVCSLSQ